jgi:peptide/nickel transport system permease protein
VRGYLLRRLATSVVVVLGIALLTFVLLHSISASPGRAELGPKASTASVNAFNRANGFDRSLLMQFISYVWKLLHGDLGYSYKLNQTVVSILAERSGRSAYLSGTSLFLSVVIAIPLGIFQAVKRNKLADHAVTTVAFTAYSMPQNFLGLILIGVLAVNLGWFPAEAPQYRGLIPFMTDFRAMFLPILTLTVTSVAGYSRYMRTSALDALAQDYIRLARAKGLPESRVLRRHLLRNASLSMITLVGLSIPALLGGNLIVENLFNSNGLGLLFVNQLSDEDYPTVIALVLIGGVLTVVGNLLADVALTFADPRIRIA